MSAPQVIIRAQNSSLGASRCLLSNTVRHLTTQCPPNYVRPAGTTAAPPHRRDRLEQWRPLSSTPLLQKKGGKAAREEKEPAGKSPSAPAKAAAAAAEDPFDLSHLESEIASALERLKSDLSKLRTGGRFNPESVENLRVAPSKSDPKTTVKLSDLAQVIPKGRTVQILVGEKDHIKPITSTILSSTLSLSPQPDPTGANPLMLVLNIPPPTAETRRAAVDEAGKAGERAGGAVREARGRQQKKMRGLKSGKGGDVRPDDLRKALGLMEKVAEKGAGEVKKVVENAKKVLESG